jgi:hypothetical protein
MSTRRRWSPKPGPSPAKHAKAGDAATIAGYLGSSDQFDDALAKYSEAYAYADQAERDFTSLQAAIRSGRLSTEPAKDAGLEFLL